MDHYFHEESFIHQLTEIANHAWSDMFLVPFGITDYFTRLTSIEA